MKEEEQERKTRRRKTEARGNSLYSLMPSRYIFAVIACIGTGIIYGLKVNLSVAIVSMVNNTALEEIETNQRLDEKSTNQTFNVKIDNDKCLVDEKKILNSSKTYDTEDGPFVWSKTKQGTILSSYFWGYILTQLPGGRVAELFSAKWVLMCSVAINVIGTLLTPVLTEIHYTGLIVLRFLEGLAAGVSFPAMTVMLARWAPPPERAIMNSITFSGVSLGTVVFTLVTGMIAKSYGWKAIFYIEGGVSAVWLVMCYIFMADSPNDHSFISQKERDFINTSLNVSGKDFHKNKKRTFPWKKVLTSREFIAVVISHVCFAWGWFMILIELPVYMKKILKYNISENALLSSIPFLASGVSNICVSKIMHLLLIKEIISITNSRKLCNLLSCVVPIFCFAALCFIECDKRNWAIVLMIVEVAFISLASNGFMLNYIDMAPNFAGTLMAIGNSCCTIAAILAPLFVGKLTEADSSIRSWRIIFGSIIVMSIIEAVIYTFWGSSDLQPWNEGDADENGDVELEEQPLKEPKIISSN